MSGLKPWRRHQQWVAHQHTNQHTHKRRESIGLACSTSTSTDQVQKAQGFSDAPFISVTDLIYVASHSRRCFALSDSNDVEKIQYSITRCNVSDFTSGSPTITSSASDLSNEAKILPSFFKITSSPSMLNVLPPKAFRNEVLLPSTTCRAVGPARIQMVASK